MSDEAAGIVKFKRRKNLSVKKLEEERMNLTRVNDILQELEKQLGPLEKQSETAKEYLKKKEELKTYDINMFLLEEERIRDCLKETQKKLEIASLELEESNISYDKMKTEYEAIEEEVEEIDLAIETAKNRLNETNLLKQQLEGQINVLREQINTARMNDEHYDNRLNTVQSEINMRKEQKASFEEEKKNLSEKLREASQADTVVKKQTDRCADIRLRSIQKRSNSGNRKLWIFLETELLRKQKSNILIQREIKYQQENPCLQEIF